MARTFTKYPKNYVKASVNNYQYDVTDLATGDTENVRANSHKDAVEQVSGCPVIRTNSNDADYMVYYGGGLSDKYALYNGRRATTYYYKCV